MRRDRFIRLCAVVAALIGSVSSLRAEPERYDLLEYVAKFRQQALTDAESAFAEYGVAAVRERIAHYNSTVWADVEPDVGWSYFFGVSPIGLGSLGGTTPIVSFYNPWADVFLLTEWRVREGGLRMTDVEFVNGDWMRQNPDGIIPSPLWRRSVLFRPEALAISYAQSIAAFEDVVPLQADMRVADFADYRDEPLLRELNEAAVKLLLTDAIVHIQRWRWPLEDDPARLVRAREHTWETLDVWRQGDVGALLDQAKDTSPVTRDWLARNLSEWDANLQVLRADFGPDGMLVYLVPDTLPVGFVTFLYLGAEPEEQLRRIDVISYQQAYEELTGPAAAREGGP